MRDRAPGLDAGAEEPGLAVAEVCGSGSVDHSQWLDMSVVAKGARGAAAGFEFGDAAWCGGEGAVPWSMDGAAGRSVVDEEVG